VHCGWHWTTRTSKAEEVDLISAHGNGRRPSNDVTECEAIEDVLRRAAAAPPCRSSSMLGHSMGRRHGRWGAIACLDRDHTRVHPAPPSTTGPPDPWLPDRLRAQQRGRRRSAGVVQNNGLAFGGDKRRPRARQV